MAIADCLELPPPPQLPRLEIPQFGLLEAARQSLYDLPDLSNYIMRLQDAAALALAPLRRFLELLEVLISIEACFFAIIDALFPPSPGPIIDCLKEFAKSLARLLAYIPPFPYVQVILDLCDYTILLVDEIVALFQLLDAKLSEYKVTLADALELGDLELAAITDCAGTETTALTLNLMDTLKFVTPLITVIVTPIARLIPIPAVSDQLIALSNIPATLDSIKGDLESTEGPPVVEDLVTAMFSLRNIAVTIYNLLAPVVGKPSDRQIAPQVPKFVNI
jgi:hypothetical protein